MVPSRRNSPTARRCETRRRSRCGRRRSRRRSRAHAAECRGARRWARERAARARRADDRVKRELAAAGLLAGAGLAAYAGWIEPRRLVVNAMELELPQWPRHLSGMRVAAVSDLHAGVPHVGLATIRRVVETMNALEPDVHLLLGDYLDASQVLQRPLAPE